MADVVPKPRRVLMTADTVGGVWMYALELAKGLGAHGVEVAIASMGKSLTPDQWQAVRQIPNLEVFESRFKLEWMEDPWLEVDWAGEWLLHLEEMVQPDLVHLNNYGHGALPWRSPTLMVAHSCVLSWWQAVKGEAVPAKWQPYRTRVAQGLQAADLVVAPSRAMLAALQAHYPVNLTGRVIPNGRDPEGLVPQRKRNFVLAIGRLWDDAKNIAALSQVADDVLWPTYVIGAAQHPNGPTASVTQLQHLGQLPFEAVLPWLTRAGIYALPARYEPFGLSILEAGMAGCALVVGDIPSLREIWGDAAVFVPPDDPDALKATLNALIADDQQRQMLGNRARQRSLQFTLKQMVSGYLAAYADLLRPHQSPSVKEAFPCRL